MEALTFTLLYSARAEREARLVRIDEEAAELRETIAALTVDLEAAALAQEA
ncbi:hypothetical protein OYT00_11210 [Microbacterium paraoxydans]|uniref:hypothetical protein n=1 Tax=Microbacterium paraoxydans TaxID=199592 RepID=UPI002285FC15|nr:hypothetical protein [Microbacterium paraoxydans]MCZ0710569.1 hypothetical protein [Microbacterium paraoxydans]